MFFLDEIKPKVFVATFHDHYDMCNVFLRFQEKTESLNEKFRDFPFTINEFQKWYSKNAPDQNYSYHNDWAGFLLEKNNIAKTLEQGIPDINKWDQIFLTIYATCSSRYPNDNFVLIGLSRSEEDGIVSSSTLNHELAHAFYALEPKYKKSMDKLIAAIPNTLQELLIQVLSDWGYNSDCYADEIQAYLSTGIDYQELLEIQKMSNLEKIRLPFQKVFNTYRESDFKKITLIENLTS